MTSIQVKNASGQAVDVDVVSTGDGNRQVVTLGAGDADTLVAVSPDGAMLVSPRASSESTPTYVAAATTAATLLPGNPRRVGFSLYNDSNQVLTVLCGTGAVSGTRYTVRVPADSYFESNFDWRGEVRGVWAGPTPTGGVAVTEFAVETVVGVAGTGWK